MYCRPTQSHLLHHLFQEIYFLLIIIINFFIMATQLRTAQIKDGAITNAKQNFGTPSAGTDAVILSYLQSYVADAIGASNLKDAVRVATTANGALATAFAN